MGVVNGETGVDKVIVFEFKAKGKEKQYKAIDEAIRTSQFVRNKCVRLWMDSSPSDKVNKYTLSKYCSVLAKKFPFADELNSMSRQVAADRAWSSIARFYSNCKKGIPGKKGYPKFKKNSRSVEYKTTGWKLEESRKVINFTDKKGIGRLKLKGTYDLHYYQIKQIKRVRIVRRADGYYVQFCIDAKVQNKLEPTKKAVGLDVGIKYFFADSNGNTEYNPQFYRKSEKQLNRANRKKSRKYDPTRKKAKQKQSNSYHKARNRYARKHLRVSRQRKEYALRMALRVIHSNDVIVYEDLKVKNMVRNRKLAKSISDVAWYTFRTWLEYFGFKYGRITVAVPPHNTSQNCSNCGEKVVKSLSTRTHVCKCGYVEDRDVNAAINILKRGLNTVGHTGIYAGGDLPSWAIGYGLSSNGGSLCEQSPNLESHEL